MSELEKKDASGEIQLLRVMRINVLVNHLIRHFSCLMVKSGLKSVNRKLVAKQALEKIIELNSSELMP